jgi:DNA-binding PadR family transcriptional regulator
MNTQRVTINDSAREIERRILNEFMDLLILFSLNLSNQISGYDVIKYVQARYRFLLSPGTVYSCLYQMERDGLLKGKRKGKKRLYILTQQGAETAKALLNAKDRILNFMSTIIQKTAINSPPLPPLPLASSTEPSLEL